MPRFTPIQTSFNAGEWSRLMHGRTDLETYKRACNIAENFQIVPQGGLQRRSASRYVLDTKSQAIVQSFIFSDIQAYTIELGEKYARFYANEGLVVQQTLANFFPVEDLSSATDEFTFVGHGYNTDDGPLRISSTGTLPTGFLAGTDYYIKVAETLVFAPADIDTGPNEDITILNHDLQTQMGPYRWSASTTIPAGMSFETDYYIVRVDANKFQVSLTKGGAAQPFTGSAGAGVLQLIPTDEYVRDKFRLTLGPGGPGVPIVALGEGTGLHTLTPQAPIAIEITTPYLASEVTEIQFAQSADVLYMTHKNHQPRTISRLSPAGFAMALYETLDGPYLDQNLATDHILTPGAATGLGITITSEKPAATAFPMFRGSDVGRTIRMFGGTHWGYAKIVAVDPRAFQDAAISQATLHATPATAFPGANLLVFAAAHGMDTGEVVRFKIQTAGSLSGTGIDVMQDYWIGAASGTSVYLYTSLSDAIGGVPGNRVVVGAGAYAATVSMTTSVIDIPAHGFIGGEGPVQLTNEGGALPDGLLLSTNYYIVFHDANAFALSLSRGGSTVGINDAADGGTHTVHGDAVASSVCIANVIVDLENTTPTSDWRLSAWGSAADLGFPRAVTFFEQRLWFAATQGKPDTLFASRTGNFVNFGPTGELTATTLLPTVGDSNGIVYEIGANQVDVISWMSTIDRLVLGTNGTNWTLSAALQGEAITPNNPAARQTSSQGSAETTPVVVGERVIAVSRSKLKLFSLGISADSDLFTTEDLTLFAEHVTLSGIVSLDYAPEPYSTIWSARVDGELACLTLIRDQRIAGWTRHILGGRYVDSFGITFATTDVNTTANTITETAHGLATGTIARFKRIGLSTLPDPMLENTDYYANAIDFDTLAFHSTRLDAEKNINRISLTTVGTLTNNIGVATNAVVESVAVIPSPSGDPSLVGRANRDHDQVWMIVKRTVNGVTVRSVEFLEDFFAEDDVTEDAFFVDSGVTYNDQVAPPTTTIANLTHFRNETVDVLADGRPILGAVVSDAGVLTLAVAASKVHVGYRFDSTLQTLRQSVDDQQGTAQGKLGKITHLTMRLFKSLGGKYGENRQNLFDLGRLLVPQSLKTDVVAPAYTGDIDLPFDGGWTTESPIYITQEEPLPFTVVALLPSLEKGTRPNRGRGGAAT